jgi:hypothetical protein
MNQNASGTLHLFNPSSTTYVKNFMANMNSTYYADYTVNSYIAGYGNTTSAINAVNFQMSSGNIDDGKIFYLGLTRQGI